jgi:predicted ATPase
MIKSFVLKNFKSHKETEVKFGNVTLLCGQNGVGKSSLIQALLLLRQTHGKNRLNKVLELNKPLCELGTATDVLYEKALDDTISFSLETNVGEISWVWSVGSNRKSTLLELKECKNNHGANVFAKSSLFNENFQYLSAARLSPKESYERNSFEVEFNRQISENKGQGELVAHFLDFYRKIEVNSYLINNPTSFTELIHQVSEWEREISKDINIIVNEVGSEYEIKYSFNTRSGETSEFRAENVGFGVSYSLPVIAAILSAKNDALLLIENPEAHLHPSGQAKLAELIALAGQIGVQIIIETHSDHIINGILVACKKYEDGKKGIDKEKVKIYYFVRDYEEHVAEAIEIKVLKDGKIDRQPSGFFDQFEKDLDVLMGF